MTRPNNPSKWIKHINFNIIALMILHNRYGVDEVYYLENMKDVLSTMMKGNKPTLLTLLGTNTDSGKTTRTAAFDGISEFKTDSKVLHPIISELRVIKTEEELNVLRYVADVSSKAHMQVMRHIKPGMKVGNHQILDF